MDLWWPQILSCHQSIKETESKDQHRLGASAIRHEHPKLVSPYQQLISKQNPPHSRLPSAHQWNQPPEASARVHCFTQERSLHRNVRTLPTVFHYKKEFPFVGSFPFGAYRKGNSPLGPSSQLHAYLALLAFKYFQLYCICIRETHIKHFGKLVHGGAHAMLSLNHKYEATTKSLVWFIFLKFVYFLISLLFLMSSYIVVLKVNNI